MLKKLLLIINPRAGKTQSRAPLFDAVSTLCEAGYLVHIHNTTGRGDATETAARQGRHYDVVACSGGDGTLNETIAGVMQLEKKPLLAYLPRGTTNDFASSLHISSNPVKAAAAIAAGNQRVLDIGQWNDRYFVYVASFGAFTHSSYSVSQAAKNALGHFAYILEGMKRLPSIKSYQMKFTAENLEIEGDFIFGMITNSMSVGGFKRITGKYVELDDGEFEVTLIKRPTNAIELNQILTDLVNRNIDTDQMYCFKTASLHIESEEEVPWTLDGEFGGKHYVVDMQNRKQALEIRVPWTLEE